MLTDLAAIARSLFAPGKGILAADESVHSATTRLAQYGVSATPEMRRQFRDLFLDAPGAERYLSGVILFTETLEQKGSDKKLFPKSLAARGIAPGVKVDEGTEPLPASADELITKGLIGLVERLAEYKKQDAVFTKWRAVYKIDGDRLPSAQAIHENAKRLASYAKDVQAAGMVPIVETDVLIEGTHSRKRMRAALEAVHDALFSVMDEYAVDRASAVLKTAMATSGAASGKRDTPEEVAEDTVEALLAKVPPQLAGVVFLSGGQDPDQATANLAAIAKLAKQKGTPWPLTFSYARALQDEALEKWQGKAENVPAARAAFLERLELCAAAVNPTHS